MDRQIVYPGSIPLDTDLLSMQRATMVALGYLARAALGTSVVADGLECQPTTPPSMTLSVAPGSLTQLANVDSVAFGSLAAASQQPLVKTGINADPVTFKLTAPVGVDQSVTYLIQAAFSEADATPVVLPYYNAAAPEQPFYGPANSGGAQSTQRLQRVQIQIKQGNSSAGTPTIPTADSGWTGLYVVTVRSGQMAVTASDIAPLPAAPFLLYKLPQLSPGFSRQYVFGASAAWTTPIGVHRLRVRLVGGGGGGGGGSSSYSGAGGGAGGYAEGIFAVTPGQAFNVDIGAGGVGSAPGSSGGQGGTTAFGSLLSATGGQGGGSSNPNSNGGQGGVGQASSDALGPLLQYGGYGTDGFQSTTAPAGNGGASMFGGGGRGASGGGSPANGQASGSGGGGGYGNGAGGVGANGLVVVEY